MYSLYFDNVTVKDTGYGVEVEGVSLSELISEVLGTRVGDNYGYGSGLPEFEANSCEVLVRIIPKEKSCKITRPDKESNKSITEFREALQNGDNEKAEKTGAEE